MPKNGFPIPTAKNRFHILNLHPKKHISRKNTLLLMPIYYLLEKFPPKKFNLAYS